MRIHLASLFLLLSVGVFAEDPATKSTLEAVDRLVADRKYESAYRLLANEDHNPSLVAKRVEVATNYFVQSINHQFFAFKDLTGAETLDALRRGTGTFSSYAFDPEVVIGNLLNAGVNDPILHQALGDYFYDVSLRYQGRWTQDDQTVARKAMAHYQEALAGGLVTTTILTNYADKATQVTDYRTAQGLYQRALGLDPALFNANFNLAYCSLRLGDDDLALAEGERAIAKYARYPNYRMDAILLCSDAAFNKKDHALALDYLGRALEISRDEYRVYQKLGNVYLAMGRMSDAQASLDRLFAFAPTNPAATQMVERAYLNFHQDQALFAFYQRNLQKYADLPEAQGNLLFHQGLRYEAEGRKAEALASATQAREAFVKAGKYSGQAQSAVEALVARNSQAAPKP